MNPVDHPHGGGEGRTSGGRHPVSPWGKPTKGKKTRSNKRTTSSSSVSRQSGRRRKPVARSVWKGPFVDGYLLKKAEAARVRPQRGDQDLEPPLHDPAAVRRPDLRRLQRPEACSRVVSEEMVGHKFGEFSPTRTFHGHAARQEGKKA